MTYEFIEAIPTENIEPPGWWAVVRGRDGIAEIWDDCYETKEEAEAEGRKIKREMAAVDREWQHEIAREEGMLQGLNAYNEVMGYD